MQAWRMRALIIAIIVLLPFEVVLLVALWPYLPWVGKAFAGMLVTFCVCGAVYVVALTWQRIRAPHVIVAGDVVVMLTRTGYEHLSAKHEAAKLQLPAPVTVTEDHRSTEETVLELHSRGIGFKKIALSTGWTEYEVRKLCNTHDGKPM